MSYMGHGWWILIHRASDIMSVMSESFVNDSVREYNLN